MYRSLGAIALTLALAGCQSDRASVGASVASFVDNGLPRAVHSTMNLSDTRIAKTLFGAMTTASAQASEPIGGFSQGCQSGAVQLAETGPTWQAMRLSRNRNWAQPVTVGFLQELSAFAATQPGWQGLYIGDMSQPRGGPMLTGHASHQTGLDADIWMLPPARLDLTRAEREAISSIRMDRQGGAYINSDWSPQHEAILRRAAMDPRVNRIFVFPAAKVAMCDNATGDRSWLNKIRPWAGHNYHFHVRLNCPAGTSCVSQDPIPAGDGCDDARQWVANLITPPPPDPNYVPPPARVELTMASLPGQCLSVLNSN